MILPDTSWKFSHIINSCALSWNTGVIQGKTQTRTRILFFNIPEKIVLCSNNFNNGCFRKEKKKKTSARHLTQLSNICWEHDPKWKSLICWRRGYKKQTKHPLRNESQQEAINSDKRLKETPKCDRTKKSEEANQSGQT